MAFSIALLCDSTALATAPTDQAASDSGSAAGGVTWTLSVIQRCGIMVFSMTDLSLVRRHGAKGEAPSGAAANWDAQTDHAA